jgi:metal-responsive CopG/Arc/MetJ family transcriptional regulator
MTAITVTVPPDVLKVIDELREREFLSRSSWLRREVILAVRASRLDPMTETKGSA